MAIIFALSIYLHYRACRRTVKMSSVYLTSRRLFEVRTNTTVPPIAADVQSNTSVVKAVLDVANENPSDEYDRRDARRTLRFLEDLVTSMQEAKMMNETARFTAYMSESESLLSS